MSYVTKKSGKISQSNSEIEGSLTVRYDQESDYVQIYNGASWINWMQVGLQFINFLKLAENQWTITPSNATYAYNFSNNTLTLTAYPKTGGGSVTFLCNVPVSNKKRITIEGRVFLYTAAQADISVGSYKYTTPQAPSKWVNISVVGDLTGVNADSKLRITLPCYENYEATKIQLTKLLIE